MVRQCWTHKPSNNAARELIIVAAPQPRPSEQIVQFAALGSKMARFGEAAPAGWNRLVGSQHLAAQIWECWWMFFLAQATKILHVVPNWRGCLFNVHFFDALHTWNCVLTLLGSWFHVCSIVLFDVQPYLGCWSPMTNLGCKPPVGQVVMNKDMVDSDLTMKDDVWNTRNEHVHQLMYRPTLNLHQFTHQNPRVPRPSR